MYFIISGVLGSVPHIDVAIPIVKLIPDNQYVFMSRIETDYLQPIWPATQVNWVTGTRH